jgi:hypothetical protein
LNTDPDTKPADRFSDPAIGSRFRTHKDIKHAKRDFQIEFDRAMIAYAHRPMDELKAMLEDGISLPPLTKLAIRILVKAVETGSPGYVEMVLYPNVRKFNKSSSRGPKKKGDETPAEALNLPDPE